jgi:membrane protease YdiL (CAAX protease family)
MLLRDQTGIEKRYNGEMPSEVGTVPGTPVPSEMATRAVGDKRLRYFELCLVLLVALSTPFLNSLFLFFHGPGAIGQMYPFRWINPLLHEILALLVLSYVLLRRGRRFRDLGLSWSFRDCGVGVIVAIAGVTAYLSFALFVQLVHYVWYKTLLYPGHVGREIWGHPGIGSVPYFLLTPFFEEMIVRAYLMTEILELTGSSLLAVVVSAIIQASYHLYYGWYIAISLTFLFLIFSLYYARYRHALPTIVAHEVIDLIALIRFW